MSDQETPFGLAPSQDVPPMPDLKRPTRSQKNAQRLAEVAQQRWTGLMQSTHTSAQAAWDSGRSHYALVARLEYADGSPPDDVAGMLQVVTKIGWVLFSSDVASAVRVKIPGGMASFGGVGVLGKDQYASDLIAVYTFAKPASGRVPL